LSVRADKIDEARLVLEVPTSDEESVLDVTSSDLEVSTDVIAEVLTSDLGDFPIADGLGRLPSIA
jgi:hypothetical protein